MKWFIPLFILLAITGPVSALSMTVSGGTTNQAVTVTLDEEAMVTFSLNDGTPIYAKGTVVRFIPHTGGKLTINAINATSGEIAKPKTVTVSNNPSPKPTSGPGGGGDGDGDDGLPWQTISLGTGTFTQEAANNAKSYNISWQTALGVLKQSGVGFTFSDNWYDSGGGLLLTSIAGKSNEGSGGWMYQVNGNTPMVCANRKTVSDGDKIVYYYSDSMSSTPETSANKFYFLVKISKPDTNVGTDGSDDEKTEDKTITGEGITGVASSIGLPEGATLTLDKNRMYLSINMDLAKSTGEKISLEKNRMIIRRGGVTLYIEFEDFKERNNLISGAVKLIKIETDTIASEFPKTGNVSASFSAELFNMPVDARQTTTIVSDVSSDTREAFMLAASGDDKHIEAIAYALDIVKSNLEDGTDIGSATIRMTVGKDWVNANGGKDAIKIMHMLDDGTVEILDTVMTGYDSNGNMIFEAVSPNGLSVFALVATGEGATVPTGKETQPIPPGDKTDISDTPKNVQDSSIIPIIIGAILIIIILSGGIYYWRKTHEK